MGDMVRYGKGMVKEMQRYGMVKYAKMAKAAKAKAKHERHGA